MVPGSDMSQRPGGKSLVDQQNEFKRNLLSQAKTLQSISEARVSAPRTHAYDHLAVSGTTGERHVNSFLFSIISFLKEKDRPVSLDEVKQYLKIDIAASPELLRIVSNNERISCSLPFLEYKPLHNIRTKEALQVYLKKHAIAHGFDINTIREIFPKVGQAAQELMAARLALGFGPKEENCNILFFNDLILSVYPDSDVKKLWHGQLIPDEHDLQNLLQKAGLKGLEVVQEKPTHTTGSKRPSTNRFRRIKMTNTHLTDFDFSQEYPGE